MNKLNNITSVILIILITSFIYIIFKFNAPVNVYSDGQTGIGSGIMWVLLLFIGLVSFGIDFITLIVILWKKELRGIQAYANLGISLFISIWTYWMTLI